MAGKPELLSRMAAGDGHGENSSYFDGWKAYDENPFDLHHNRGGVIQMGLAENQVRISRRSLVSACFCAISKHP
jgi:1-aminocyclopropane-1-carboxylate synthase